MPGRCAFDEIKFGFQSREFKSSKHLKPAKGFDTETDKGYARIISDGSKFIEAKSLDDILSFLVNRDNRDYFNLWWNINFDFAAIFKWEPDVLNQLMKGDSAEYKQYKIKYISRKSFTIHNREEKFINVFFDLYQFYHTSLGNASRTYLGEEPHEFKEHRDKIFELYPINEIGLYCQDDAQKTQKLGTRLLAGFDKLGLKPKKLYSTGYISQEFTLRTADIPVVYNLPKSVSRMYWEAYYGGWFDIYQRGVFNGTSYDINSAYPAELRSLPDIRDGEWKPKVDESQDFGVILTQVSNDLQTCQPLALQLKNRKNLYPIFDKPTIRYMTLGEYKAYKEFMKIKPIKGWTFYPDADCRYPYRKMMDDLFEAKSKAPKDTADYLVPKLVANSCYGKAAQLTMKEGRWEAGKLFNPFYAAETTARTRVNMFKRIIPYQENVVTVLTDAVVFDKDITLSTSSKLGDFSLKSRNKPCLMLQCGIYQYDDLTGATRGFSKGDNLWELVNRDGKQIEVHVKKPKTFKESIIQDKFFEINVFNEVPKIIDLSRDIKRLWPSEFQLRDLLNGLQTSKAVPISLFS